MSHPSVLEDDNDDDDARALVRRLARNEHGAVVETYRAHHSDVRRFAQRLLGDPTQAEDLVHEVFLALPDAAKRFRGECSMKAFVVSIAARRAYEHIRAAKRRRSAEARMALEPKREPTRPDADAERRELADALSRALDSIPNDQRVAFVLCEVEERTSTEVAAMLGESDGTVRARVFHAKKKLRDVLEGQLEGQLTEQLTGRLTGKEGGR